MVALHPYIPCSKEGMLRDSSSLLSGRLEEAIGNYECLCYLVNGWLYVKAE